MSESPLNSPTYGLMAEFDSAQELMTAAHRTHEAGYQKLDAYSPFPIEGLAEAIGFHKNRVAFVVLIGGVIGGVVGAVSSAFGGGETSKEAQSDWHIDTALNSASPAQRQAAMSQMSPSQSTQYINGLMNAHDNSPGHSEQIEQVFGKNGVNNLMTQMTTNINAAIAKNPQLQFASPSTLYSSVVTPWLKSKGVTISPSSVDKNGNNEGAGLGDAITNMIGDWQSGSWTSSTPVGVAGQTINIPAYSQAGTVQMEQNMLTQMAGMI